MKKIKILELLCFVCILFLFTSVYAFGMDDYGGNPNNIPFVKEYGYKYSVDWTPSDYKDIVDFPYVFYSGEIINASNTQYYTDYKVYGIDIKRYICVGYVYMYGGQKYLSVLCYDKDTKEYLSAVNVYHQMCIEDIIYNDDTPTRHSEVEGGSLRFYYSKSIVDANIPIFDSIENCDNYVQTGSFNGILNDSYLPYAFDLECPIDLKCELLNRTAGYERFSFTWSQKDKDYINWDTEFLFYCDLRYRKQIFGFIGVSDWVNVDDFFVFDKFCSTSNLKYSTELYCSEYDDALNFYFSSINEDLGGKQIEILGADFYVRNKYVDAASGKAHYSNWVRVHYTSNGDDIEVSYSEIEVDDPDSVGSNGKPAGTLNPDNGYTGEVQQATVNSASGLVDFVKNGFGLLGNNGLVSFLKQTLAFVPVEFWEIIIIGVSFFVLIAIIKFARG